MDSKKICVFRCKYIIFAVVILIICCTYVIFERNFLKLEVEDYTMIECQSVYDFSVNDPEKISCIFDFMNDNIFYKELKCSDTLRSPEVTFLLSGKDGQTENIEIYSGAWDDGLYLVYNDNQYKIKNSDKFYANMEKLYIDAGA